MGTQSTPFTDGMRRSKGNYRDSTVDPPVAQNGARLTSSERRAPVDTATGGSGFPNEGTIWDVFSGRPDCLSDISDFLNELDESPRLRASANLRTLSRVREELERIPQSASMGDPVQLRLQDVLLLMDQLMRRMR